MNRSNPKKIVPVVVILVLVAVAAGVFVSLGLDDRKATPVEQAVSGAYDQSAQNAKVMKGEALGTTTPEADPATKRAPETQGRQAPDNTGGT